MNIAVVIGKINAPDLTYHCSPTGDAAIIYTKFTPAIVKNKLGDFYAVEHHGKGQLDPRHVYKITESKKEQKRKEMRP